MRTQQQQVRDWLSVLSRGIGICAGTYGIYYEFILDHLRNTSVLWGSFGALGIGLAGATLIKTVQVTLKTGTLIFEARIGEPPEPDAIFIRPVESLPHLGTSRPPLPRDGDPPRSPPETSR